MRPVLLLCGLALVLALAGIPTRATAASKEGKKVTKLQDQHGKGYDLTKKEDLDHLHEKLSAGEIESLGAVKEVNLMELRWDTALWTIVVFVLLFFILKKAAWGPMLEGLQKREDNIQAALVEAKQAREEARKLKDELTAERNKAAEKVAEMMAEARRDAELAKNEMISKAKAEIQTERDRLLREVNTAKDQALQEIWRMAADLATTISSKAVKKSLSPDDHRKLIDEAIAEMGSAQQERKRMLGL